MFNWIDLMLLNGEIVHIECPRKFEDEVRADIENAMKRGDWLPLRQYEGCSATYMGIEIDRVNARQIAAML